MSSYDPPPPPFDYESGDNYSQPPTAPQKRPRTATVLISGLIGLVLGVAGTLGGVALWSNFDDDSTTAGSEASGSLSPEADADPDSARQEESTPPAAQHELTVDDFDVEISVKEQSCFGSAGCNVTLRTEPTYLGLKNPTGTWEVTYEITSIEDEPMIRSFELDGQKASFDDEARVQTPESDADIQIEITDVKEGFSQGY